MRPSARLIALGPQPKLWQGRQVRRLAASIIRIGILTSAAGAVQQTDEERVPIGMREYRAWYPECGLQAGRV